MGQTGEDWRETLSCMGAETYSKCPELWEMTEGEICYENIRQGFSECCNGFPEKNLSFRQ
ncbi:MAG: hypothetical protein K2N72_11850 [Oscillospiraceae bacterium]|nr:hypothetical protein [Oscillospiraceae bacterium]